MNNNDIDLFMIQVSAAREARERELREAFRHPSHLDDLIFKDSANLVAGVGGYVAPIDKSEREKWIADRMMNDPFFRTKAQAIHNLVREYVDFTRR